MKKIISFFTITFLFSYCQDDPKIIQPIQISLAISFKTGPVIIQYGFGKPPITITYDTLNKAGLPTNSVGVKYYTGASGHCVYCKAINSTEVAISQDGKTVADSKDSTGVQIVNYCLK